MKHAQVTLVLTLALIMAACGGSGSKQSKKNQPGGPGGAIVDPSGNWSLVASDGQNAVALAALFNQVGAVVTANSFTAAGNPAPFNCLPFTAALANGNVGDVNQFTGDVTVHYAVDFPNDLTPTQATFSFDSRLNDAGTSFTGSYSGMPACAGIASTGSFSGTAIPSTTAAWTGTITPCTFDPQNASCADSGASGSVSADLVEDDATGNVSGSYSVSDGLAGWQGGTIAVTPADQDILSGFVWQFTLTDASGNKYIANGMLDLNNNFAGVVTAVHGPDAGTHFNLHMSH